MKLLHTKPSVKIMNTIYHDLYYTIIENRDEKDNNENEYIIFDDFITPNDYTGIRPRETILK